MKRHILSLLTGLVLILFLLGMFGRHAWLLDLISQFRIYYLSAFTILLLVAILLRRWLVAAVCILPVVFILIGLAPFFLNDTAESTKGDTRLCSINVYSKNGEPAEMLKFVLEEKPDILIIMELNEEWLSTISELMEIYPYSTYEERVADFGISLFSKTAFRNLEIPRHTSDFIPSILAEFTIKGQELTLLATHPDSPKSAQTFRSRNEQLQDLNRILLETDGHTIVAGDLNCTTFSPNFSLLTAGTGLLDTRLGRGLQPTWSANLSLVSLSIDHCFVSPDIQVTDRRVGRYIGSDHYPIVVDFTLK